MNAALPVPLPATDHPETRSPEPETPFGFLDDDAVREIRRACLKALAIPGYQVPYASREMPMARGFGTGGMQLTLALAVPGDALKVIDQGADDSVNAVALRGFIQSACPGLATTADTAAATVIQTRHRVPDRPLAAGQLMVYQVPYPDPLQIVEPNEERRRRMHAEGDYARLWVKLYEDVVRFREVAISNRYPARVAGRLVIDPSPIPRWDLPKLHRSPVPHLFGAGREKKIYAVPPFTEVEPLAFSDVPFEVEQFRAADGSRRACARCGATTTYLDEIPLPDGSRRWQCNDQDACGSASVRGPGSGVRGHAPAMQAAVEARSADAGLRTPDPGPLLRVRDLARVHGRGCARCLEATGDAAGRNTCPHCGAVVALAGASFDLFPGEILGIMGESGSGKSTLVRLLHGDDRPTSGSAMLANTSEEIDLATVDGPRQRRLRHQAFGMVYQNPHLGLNFGVSAGGNIAERLLCAGERSFQRIRERALELLSRTEIAATRIDHAPGTFSGGMQQRLQIARAIAPSPSLLFLDEVTTGLDLSVQARILDLVLEIQRASGVAMIVVTHDLGVVRLLAGRTLVLRHGRVVESGLTDQILEDPQHAYTQQLVMSSL
jgi:alpha-D-ribose 1-methylphosphonate 5-phosphate C-P lyase